MKQFLFISLILLAFDSYSQKITRGPDIGEIYFLGPTYSGEGLYYSTDFGETATFVDGNMNYISIVADKIKGGIYCTTLPVALYFSNEYGYSNTWEYKSSDLSSEFIFSGYNEGHIFSSCYKHSEDFGSNFIIHSLNGWFGSGKYTAIDNVDENIGYALVYKMSQADSLYLLKTIDTFENVDLIYQWNEHHGNNIILSSGFISGELFLMDFTQNRLFLSQNYGDDFILIDRFNYKDQIYLDMGGGRQTGEIYILYCFVNMLWQNAHVYIYHSLDYGKTFEVFHPFAKGNEPILANFSSDTTEGEMPFTVDFCNFSIGDIQQYEWDFENDGTIDSYEQSPIWTYQDTGYYSVKLKVIGSDSANTFLKENYIYVYKTVGLDEFPKNEINCYPNPFFNQITFEFSSDRNNSKIYVYDIAGQLINTLQKPQGIKKMVWEGKDKNGNKCKPGIYYVRAENNSFSKKILLIK